MTVNTYQRGDLVRISGEFRDLLGVLIDPSTVTLKVEKPAGTITTYTYPATVIRDALGKYHVDVNIDATKGWRYRWETTGTGQAAEEGQFIVEPTEF